MANSREIIFVVNNLAHSRCVKRILYFYSKGYRLKVYGYIRNDGLVNSLPEDINVVVIRKITNGKKYFTRGIQVFLDLLKIQKENKGENPIYYIFGFLMGFPFIGSKVSYIYEISDILYTSKRIKLLCPFFRYLEKKLIRKSGCTIMTSEGFLEFYNVSESDKIIIHQNKLNPKLFEFMNYNKQVILAPTSYKSSRNIVFGFVGVVRYEAIFRFASVIAERFPEYSFEIFGGGSNMSRYHELSSSFDNIVLHGPFKNPDDLPDIYERFDVLVSCYDIDSYNVRVAEPNKLFEAVFFKKPLVVTSGTFLAKKVLENNIGFAVDSSNSDSISDFLKTISIDKINEKISSMNHISENQLFDDQNDIENVIKAML